MDRARDFRFVQQLPRTTLVEVKYQEDVFDKQVLLNESWPHYCKRRHYPDDRLSEEHLKWVTETWEEYELRTKRRDAAIDDYFKKEKNRLAVERELEEAAAQKTNALLQTIADAEAQRKSKYLPSLHSLLVDFEEQMRLEHLAQRKAMEQESTDARSAMSKDESTQRKQMEKDAREDLSRVIDFLEEQRRIREEQERIRREEEERVAELKRQEEERIRREAAEAEQKRREAEEEARRAEKKRKEEERKARVKAERDARAKSDKDKLDRTMGSTTKSELDVTKTVTLTPKELREASIVARQKRMETDIDAFIRDLRKRVTAVKSKEELDGLYSHVATKLGSILFDTCVYIGIVESDIHYTFASENCSTELKSKNVHLPLTTACPTTKCITTKQPQHIASLQHEATIQRLSKAAESGKGDFSVVPITDAVGSVIAVLASDTLDTNTHQAPDPSHPGEEHVYEKGPDEVVPPTALSKLQHSWMVDIASIVSTAVLQSAMVDLPQCNSIPVALKTLTQLITKTLGAGVNCYISKLNKGDGDQAIVVSQNGKLAGETLTEAEIAPHSILLGRSLHSKKAPTFHLKGIPFEYIAQVDKDSRVEGYIDGAARKQECLLLVPITDSADHVQFVVGVEKQSPPGLTEGEITIVMHLAEQLRSQLLPMLTTHLYASLCQQCVDFLTTVTKCENVYISVSQKVLRKGGKEGTKALEYIATTPTQKFMLGQVVAEGEGTSHKVLASGKYSHWPDVQQNPDIKYLRTGVDKKAMKGSLLVCPFGDQVGCIYLDTVNSTHGPIAQGDIDIVQLVAGLLADAFKEQGKSSADSTVSLDIEASVDPAQVAFLKKVWQRINLDLKSISKNDLLEISAYNRPPELVHSIVGSTLVVLGSTTKKTATWDQCRTKVKQPLIDAMLKFDPTGKSDKKARVRFTKARKAIKGFTVETARQHGSFPTSCFFAWASVTIQLKFASDRIRKNMGAGKVLAEFEVGGGAQSEAAEDDVAADEDEGADESALPDDDQEPTAPEN
eukprot:PhF_6_TR10398/c0_g1_i2/m.16285